MKKSFKFGFLLYFLILLMSGCNSNGCYEDMSVKLYANFYKVNISGKDVAVSLDSISVWGVGSDSILYLNKTLSGFELDLNPNAQQTQFVVATIQNGLLYLDTLTMNHRNDPWFESLECGCRVFSNLTGSSVNGGIFKSAAIKDSSVINLKSEHVRLYFY